MMNCPEPSLIPPEPRIEPDIEGWCRSHREPTTTGALCLYECYDPERYRGLSPCHEWCVDFERREEAGS